MKKKILSILESYPIIPALKNDQGLESFLKTKSEIVFVLYGNILNIVEIAKKIEQSGKMVFINVDLIEGFTTKEIVLRYLKQNTGTSGILSSKASMIRAAKEQGFCTVHRLFVIDSFSFDNLSRQIDISNPDFLEILPGWPRLVTWIKDITDIPIISGGLICYKEDVVAALKAGATAICSTNPEVWEL